MAKLKGQLSEHQHQCLFVEWFEIQFPQVRIFAIPNGTYKSMASRMKHKREGLRSGVPDLFIPAWKLWIEMKAEKGALSVTQKDWKMYLEGIGQSVVVAKGFDSAKQQIIEFLDTL